MLKIFQNWYQRHFSQEGTVEFAIVLISIFLVVYYFMWLLGPLVIALCIAYCLDGFVNYLCFKFNFSRLVSSSLVMFVFLSICTFFLIILVPELISQLSQFYNLIVDMSQGVVQSYSDIEGEKTADIDKLILHEISQLSEKMPAHITGLFDQDSVLEFIHNSRTQIMVIITGFIKAQFMPSIVNAFTYLVYFIIVPIFTFLMLLNKETLKRRVREYILPNNQVLMNEFWPILNNQIAGYIRGKIIHVIIISIVNSIAFKFFALNYFFLLGIGVGLSVIIPYVGAILIGIPVLIVSLFQYGLSDTFLYLSIVYIIIQLLDSNVLTPMLFSKAMNLDAFSILLAILIFGGLWGFWGVFFSIPLATFIKTIVVGWPSTDKEKVEDDSNSKHLPSI